MNRRIEKKLVLKKSIKQKINKLLYTIIIFLIGMIATKNNPNLKETIKTNVYEKSFPFQKIKKQYEKYFGNILSVEKNIKETETVFNERLSYKKIEKYQNGAKLKVINNYMVPTIESGIVVFIGEKEKIGKTIIIEQVNGIDTFYSNINFNNLKLYDYVEKGELLGEVKNNELYLTFQKDGKYLDYKKYV